MNQNFSPCPLHPIERVINKAQNYNSPLAVAYVSQALKYYHQAVQEMPPKQRADMDAGFIGYEQWASIGESMVNDISALGM